MLKLFPRHKIFSSDIFKAVHNLKSGLVAIHMQIIRVRENT